MRTLRRLLTYFRPYVVQMVAATLMLALAGGLMSVMVMTMKPLVNDVLQVSPRLESHTAEAARGQGGIDILERLEGWLPASRWSGWLRQRAFVALPLLVVVVFAVRGVVQFFGQYLSTKVGVSIIRNIRAELYEAIVFQSLAFFRHHTTGSLLSRVLGDVQRLQRVSTEVLADVVRVTAMIPFLLVVVVIYDWRLTVFGLIVIPFLGFPIVRFGSKLRSASRRSQKSMAEVSSLLTETVIGIRVVQAFSMEKSSVARFRESLDRMLHADLKAARAAALSTPILEQLASIIGGVLFFLAGLHIARGTLDPGDFSVVLFGLGLLVMSIRRLNRSNVEIQMGLAAAERVFQVLDARREVKEHPQARLLEEFEREIRFDGVSFTYGEDRVLADVDLAIGKGEAVALVGPSGSGKTTLASLLLRFFDPTGGRITVDGIDIGVVSLASLRALIGLVTQETVVFDDTVRNNVSYGRQDVSDEQVVQAARAAHAHEFIEKMPDGYDTRLGDRGTRLSMGQRQRIAIARALLKDPPILILDEATSALDSESERLVQAGLESLLQTRTSLVIAHRLTTVQRADRIVVLENGRIAEEGPHRALLERGGLYARLYELQFRE